MDPNAIAEVLKLGFPGVVILALAIIALRKDAKVDELNEKRIAEGRESVKALEQSTQTLEGMTEVLRDIRDRSNRA